MSGASELNAWKFSPFQSNKGPTPSTIASAATIVPVSLITIVTGTTQIVTVTPPLEGEHILYLIFPDAMGAFSTGGNIKTAADPGVNIPVAMLWNPAERKYYPGPIS